MTRRTVSIGKYRALQRATTPDGHFTILALDHQDALRRAMRPAAPGTVTNQALTEFKTQVVRALAPLTSGVLLDPVYGAAQSICQGILGKAGLLVELEKADYLLRPMPRQVEILSGWSVAKIKRMGADGVKLFYYDDPDDESLAAAQDSVVQETGVICAAHDIPFYAEPILLRANEDETDANHYTQRSIESAWRAAALGVDVLKLEFPVAPSSLSDDRFCVETCRRLTESLDVPWVLLSAGVPFDVFCRQVEIACKSGASGFIVGRAVWGEVAVMEGTDERQVWLETVGHDRMRRLGEMVMAGRAWTEVIGCKPVSTAWYETYGMDAP